MGLHFKLFLKKKERKTFKEQKSKIENSGQIYNSIFKENEFCCPVNWFLFLICLSDRSHAIHTFEAYKLAGFDTELGNYCPSFHPLNKPVPISSYSSFSPPSNPSNH